MDPSFDYTFDVAARGWAAYIRTLAQLRCPRAKQEVLTAYEVQLGVGTPKTTDTLGELLHEEFQWYDSIRRRNTKDAANPDGIGLTFDDFQAAGFVVVSSVLETIVEDNLRMLAQMLEVPSRAEFTNTQDLANLFVYNQIVSDTIDNARQTFADDGDLDAKRNAINNPVIAPVGPGVNAGPLVTQAQMSTILKMLREKVGRSIPYEQYQALVGQLRLEKVRSRPDDRPYQRGQQVGTMALYRSFPLKGRVSGEGTAAAPAAGSDDEEQEEAAGPAGPDPLDEIDFVPSGKALMML